MSQIETGRQGSHPLHGRSDYLSSNNNANVFPLPLNLKPGPAPFERLTARVVLEQFRRGELPEPVLIALLAGVGLAP